MYRSLPAICSAPRPARPGDSRAIHRPPSEPKRLLRREVVHVELAGGHRQAAGPAGRVDQHQRVRVGAGHPADRHGHAGRGLVVGQRVGVDAGLGARLGMRARRRVDHGRARPATARPWSPPRTWPRTRRTTGAGRAGGSARRPQRPRTRWCRRCPAPPGSRPAGRTAPPGPPGSRCTSAADRGLPVRGAQQRRARPGQRGDLLGPHLRRAAAEPAVGGRSPAGISILALPSGPGPPAAGSPGPAAAGPGEPDTR